MSGRGRCVPAPRWLWARLGTEVMRRVCAVRSDGSWVRFVSSDGRDHTVDGPRLVVPQEQHDRHDVAVFIQQPGAGFDVAGALSQLGLLARNRAPFETALVPAGNGDFGYERQCENVLNARHVLHVPAKTIHRRHQVVAHADGLL